ncbi:ATPases involved in chromosome partitioning [Rubrobacter radiotolerans]|uniref:ATPases involved in chromosome partitioning n=1 Tax=Rubrobacter radiotolerans TaxID=42256 RepID=A0A023X5N1_RUBRA|nr:CpsD/CapB family tyrosine-protein kinase [Rubrobacter radiotolerans]AHY47623.1 ATPases involved in chromosome partitioning [Rubrobacter radiotolerans]MDX5895028.1 CpsD/CapB family tyrosine-protein kinase [Rubrobacter radiotolerans]SMC07306.1 Chromosome partitioning ATPase, Mrp family, contains Fe-S cluster [Rubrobacter radiotolerans DSM 5868]
MSLEAPGRAELEPLFGEDSAVRQHYEELAVNLISLRESVRTVVVTSPERGAGCTSVCLGLGAALVRMERSVAVVDCNLRSPHLHTMLGEPNFVGLTSGVSRGRPLEEYGHEILPGYLVLPTGPVSPSSVTVSRRRSFVEAIRKLQRTRDVVLLDAPVVREMTATPGLARGFDGVLLVVHAAKTSKQAAREAADDLLDAGARLLGVVLNGCP